jgi:tRNA-uridine aminocarboxypropyltransferase
MLGGVRPWEAIGWEPRASCTRCGRPRVVCYCAHLAPIETRTRILLLQHPREEHVPINTARIAHLCLPHSELRVGIDFSCDPWVRETLAGRAYLLYPGPDAIDPEDVPPGPPLTLVVVDGTWWQAHSLLRHNPALAILPQIRLQPAIPSRYRIRREPADHCVSTIEALAQVLGTLEGDPARLSALLAPFEAMVESQLRFVAQGVGRHHKVRRGPAGVVRDHAANLLCVHGEANAWPAGAPSRPPPEIVQWLAHRPSTGESFAAVIAPRQPLGPRTARHLGLTEEILRAGESWSVFRERWSAFVQPDDVVCSWGRYALDVLESEGIRLPDVRIDLKQVASNCLRMPVGGARRYLERLGEPIPESPGPGRGPPYLAALSEIARQLGTGSGIIRV